MKHANLSQALYKLRRNHLPIGAQIEITNRCNLDCIHCKVDINTNLHDELKLEDIASALRQLADFSITNLCLSGGEVFAHPQIEEILEEAFKLPISVSLITNATLIEDAHIALLSKNRAKLSAINVSFYALDGENHNQVVNQKGARDKTLDSILKMHAAGLPVRINGIFMKENFRAIPEVSQFAEEYAIHKRFTYGIKTMDNGNERPIQHRLSQSGEIIPPEKLWAPFDKERFCSNLMDRNRSQENGTATELISQKCGVGVSQININHRGDILPCDATQIPVGNIKRDDIKDVWLNSPILEKIRAIRTDEMAVCGACELRRFCSQCPGQFLNETGDMFRPSQEICDNTFLLYGKINKEGHRHESKTKRAESLQGIHGA